LNLRRLLPYTTVALLLTAVYMGRTFYARYAAGQEAAQKAREVESRQDQKIVDQFGGGKLKILSFSASPEAVAAGDRVLVCFSVVNATEVSIVPEIEPVKPSISRCLETHPRQSTTFTLKARDATGAEVTEATAVEIR
jgi:hypothetical protein